MSNDTDRVQLTGRESFQDGPKRLRNMLEQILSFTEVHEGGAPRAITPDRVARQAARVHNFYDAVDDWHAQVVDHLVRLWKTKRQDMGVPTLDTRTFHASEPAPDQCEHGHPVVPGEECKICRLDEILLECHAIAEEEDEMTDKRRTHP